jgi:amidase
LERASHSRSDWYRALGKLFEQFDFLAIPTAQVFPFDAQVHWPREINGHKMDSYHRWMEVVIGASLGGLPAISVPVGFSPGGLPMGMQIIGRNHADLAVLQLAHAYEQVTHLTRDTPPTLLTSL